MDETLSKYKHYLSNQSKFHAGYPYNLNYDYSELWPFLEFTINNLGDPFVQSITKLTAVTLSKK